MKLKDRDTAVMRAFTITVFILLASIDNAVLDMASSVYWAIETHLAIPPVFLGVVNSILIWTVASLAIAWGYLGDKGNRKRLLLYGTAIWCASLACTPLVVDAAGYLVVQVVAGVGLACIASVGFSVIVDFIKPEKRGIAMSFWGLSQGVGTMIGKALAALVVTDASRWWEPFFYVSLAGFGLLGAYFFTLDPKRGATEAALQGVEYEYTIKREDFRVILTRGTNVALLLQGVTAQVVWGSLTWLPYVFTGRVLAQGFTAGSAGLVGNLIAGLFAIGGVFSIMFGALGDKLQQRSIKARPAISTAGVFLGIPLFIAMLLVPFDLSSISGTTGALDVVVALLAELGRNPAFLAVFVLAMGASAMMAADSPNWFALIGDVNLPEHRGTVFGLGNFLNGVGRGIGSIALPLISVALGNDYTLALIVVQAFFIPTGFCYLAATFFVGRDVSRVRETLLARAAAARGGTPRA